MLHYYDKIGLLRPSKLSESGYRLYSEKDLEILQQILFFKELDFSLNDIKNILSAPNYNKTKALINQKQLLKLKRNRLNKLIKLIDKILGGESQMSFKEFDTSELKNTIKKYAEEAENTYGETKEYKNYKEKTSNYKDTHWQKLEQKINQIFTDFSKIIDKGPASKEAQTLVEKWKNFISENFYECSNEILNQLGDMYIQDERFNKYINKFSDGLAEFINSAIKIYCE